MDDITRLKIEYENRKHRPANKDLYSWFNKANLFTIHQRQRALLMALRNKQITDLSNLKIFEMGCGEGGVLTEFLNFGAAPHNLYGMDLLADRLAHARTQLPTSHFINGDGQRTPYPAHTFDLILQFTALSSILDAQIRQQITKDMLRILQPNGIILWYDFWLNPTNLQTHGIRPNEIRGLFPGCNIELHKITLAPPLARRIAPFSWGLAMLIEELKIFNSHYFAVITKKSSSNL